jgi:hypothetical protein
MDLDVVGTFTYGVAGTGLNGSQLVDVDVFYSTVGGISLEGDNLRVAHADVAAIGTNLIGAVFGIDIRGSYSTVDQAQVWSLFSRTEAYAVGFSAYNETGNVLSNSTVNGSGSTG